MTKVLAQTVQIHPLNQFHISSKEKQENMEQGEEAKGQISLRTPVGTNGHIFNRTHYVGNRLS